MIGGYKIVKYSGHCSSSISKIFRATRIEVTILLHSHMFKQKKYTILGATRKLDTRTSSLNCTLVSCRQEMVRSPQFNLFLFSKMTRRCNLKTCSYFGEVDNMQIICEWTHENILKQWGKSFSKQLEIPGSTYRYQGPKQTSWRTYQVWRKSVIAFSLEKQRYTLDVDKKHINICTDSMTTKI